MPAEGTAASQAKKPYQKPVCKSASRSQLLDRIQATSLLRRPQGQSLSPVIAVENYSGTLHSLLRAFDDLHRSRSSSTPAPSIPLPLIVLLNPHNPSRPGDEEPGSGAAFWFLSGPIDARDIASALAAVYELEWQAQSPAPHGELPEEPRE